MSKKSEPLFKEETTEERLKKAVQLMELGITKLDDFSDQLKKFGGRISALETTMKPEPGAGKGEDKVDSYMPYVRKLIKASWADRKFHEDIQNFQSIVRELVQYAPHLKDLSKEELDQLADSDKFQYTFNTVYSQERSSARGKAKTDVKRAFGTDLDTTAYDKLTDIHPPSRLETVELKKKWTQALIDCSRKTNSVHGESGAGLANMINEVVTKDKQCTLSDKAFYDIISQYFVAGKKADGESFYLAYSTIKRIYLEDKATAMRAQQISPMPVPTLKHSDVTNGNDELTEEDEGISINLKAKIAENSGRKRKVVGKDEDDISGNASKKKTKIAKECDRDEEDEANANKVLPKKASTQTPRATSTVKKAALKKINTEDDEDGEEEPRKTGKKAATKAKPKAAAPPKAKKAAASFKAKKAAAAKEDSDEEEDTEEPNKPVVKNLKKADVEEDETSDQEEVVEKARKGKSAKKAKDMDVEE